MTTYSYKEIETALARMHDIHPSALKAFRARLRHLRNLGIPDLPKVGSGSRVAYSLDNAEELAFALELMQFGIAPAILHQQVESYRIHRWTWDKAVKPHPNSDYMYIFGSKVFFQKIESQLSDIPFMCPGNKVQAAIKYLFKVGETRMFVIRLQQVFAELEKNLAAVSADQ